MFSKVSFLGVIKSQDCFEKSWSSLYQCSAQYSFQVTGCFPSNLCLTNRQQVEEEWILSQWLLSIFGKNIGQARINWATCFSQFLHMTDWVTWVSNRSQSDLYAGLRECNSFNFWLSIKFTHLGWLEIKLTYECIFHKLVTLIISQPST